MRRTAILLTLLLAAGCNNGEIVKPRFDPKATDLFGGDGKQTSYSLSLMVRFEKNRFLNATIGMDLDLAAWREKSGHRFVLERQQHPCHIIFSWVTGFLGPPSYNAAVKTLVVVRDKDNEITSQKNTDAERAVSHGKLVVEAWKSEYRDLLEKNKWNLDPGIVFYTPKPMKGRFGFYRGHDGAMWVEADGRTDKETVANLVPIFYRWHKPGEKDPTVTPQFFAGLAAALALFYPSPFAGNKPREVERLSVGETWPARNDHAVTAILRAMLAFHSKLSGFINPERRVAFPMTFKLEARDGDVDTIVADVTSFGNVPSVGEGIRLRRYTRRVTYDHDRAVVTGDTVRLEGRSDGNDSIRIELTLEERPR